MNTYGLTGGIASGKTTVGSFFRDYGIPVIDADQIARSLRAPGGKAADAITKRFGTIESSMLREMIANDASARKDLESILHPLIRTESEAQFELWRGRGVPYLVYEATLLIEVGRVDRFDGVILVLADSETQLSRLITRDRVKEEHARRFIDTQNAALAPNDIREKASTHRIQNQGSVHDLREKTRLLHLEFLAHAQRER